MRHNYEKNIALLIVILIINYMIPYGVFADPIAKTPSGVVQTTSLLPTVILPSLGGGSSSVGQEAYSQDIQSSDTVPADIEASNPIPSKLTGDPAQMKSYERKSIP